MSASNGPWRVVDEPNRDDNGAPYGIMNPDGFIVADVFSDCAQLPPETALANARLIAAAPTLLAALIALHEWHRSEYQSNPFIVVQAMEAIALAKP